MAVSDPGWQTKYAQRTCSAAEAVRPIRKGQRVLIGSGCAEPQLLVNALAARGHELADTQIIHLLTLGTAPYAHPAFERGFRHNAFFIGDNVREAVAQGRADFTPVFLHEVPALFRTGRVPVNAALISVSPPDEHGYCSLGISVDVVKAGAECADYLVAEVNPNMPRVLGDSFIHIDRIDRLVPSSEPVLELSHGEPDEVARRIGRNIAEMIGDGACLQTGIGTIPDCVLSELADRRDLGMHTEMFSDGVLPLIEKGVLTGARKRIHRGKIVSAFVLGTRRLYDFIDDNPMCEFHPVDYTNDPYRISRNDRMVAVNSALQVDLTGQVCADSLGTYFYSGIGGQVDFVRGAARSNGGKPIIALPSTALGGKVSRIVATLNSGAGVVTSRGDVHYVVTEWGVADLHGRTIRERANALVHVAHPDFREELMREARERHFVYADQVAMIGAGDPELEQIRADVTLRDGRAVRIRPLRPTDEDMLRDLFYSYSAETILHRFFHRVPAMPHDRLQKLMLYDHKRELILIALDRPEGPDGQPGNERILGVGRYHIRRGSGAAEVAFSMREDVQHQGLGTHLFRKLVEVGRRRGVRQFVAEVMADNQPMLALFHKCAAGPVQSHLEHGIYTLSFTA